MNNKRLNLLTIEKNDIIDDPNVIIDDEFNIIFLSYPVIELFMYYLGKVIIDGNSKIVIVVDKKPNQRALYEYNDYFAVTILYAENKVEELREIQLSGALDYRRLNEFFLNLIVESLSFACIQVGQEDRIALIEDAANKVRENNFDVIYKVKKLTKRSKDGEYTINTFRHITESGEWYYFDIKSKSKKSTVRYNPNHEKQYVPLEVCYSNVVWDGHIVKLENRFGRSLLVIDADKEEIVR